MRFTSSSMSAAVSSLYGLVIPSDCPEPSPSSEKFSAPTFGPAPQRVTIWRAIAVTVRRSLSAPGRDDAIHELFRGTAVESAGDAAAQDTPRRS